VDAYHTRKENRMKITSHPNGFLRVTFSGGANGSEDRLHVWDVPGYEDGDIHQHGADFTSKIVEGVMVEQLYAAVDDEEGDYERWTVNCWTDHEGNYHVDESAPRVKCRALLKEELTHNPGETYERPASDLHKVIAVKVPLITRGSTGPKYRKTHTMLRKLP
jgi:hypothetical protein